MDLVGGWRGRGEGERGGGGGEAGRVVMDVYL